MRKLATPLIIVVLVLSIISLVLGIMLFSHRELLKGRAQKLEDAAIEVADNVHFDDFNVNQLKEYTKMDAPLKLLNTHAANQYESLQNTKKDLEQAAQELTQAENNLSSARADLVAVETHADKLKESLETKEVELAQVSSRIDQLGQDKSNLQLQIDELTGNLVDAEEETRDLQDQVVTLENALVDLEGELGERPTRTLPKGLTGRILVVNPYWNFVVLDIGNKAGLTPSAEMLVHRHDRLVGRIRISSVKDSMAIGEILTDWEQAPIREGDNVLF